MDLVTERVLELRDSPAAPRLRRGGNAASARYAYPYLAWVWKDKPYLKSPVLRFAALAATHRDIPHRDVSLARHLQRAGQADKGIGATSIERRLLLAVNSDLERMHSGLRSMLSSAASHQIGLDFDELWKLYRLWDHPQRQTRDRTRDRLLEDYYQPDPARTDDTADTQGR